MIGMRKVFVLGIMLAATALAEPAIDFAIFPPTSGLISYAGGASGITGTGISVNASIGVNGTPLNNGVLRNCLACFLNFTTGGLSSSSIVGSSATFSFYGGGLLTITGTVDLNGNGMADAGDATGTLFSATFNGVTSVVNHTSFAGAFSIGGMLSTLGGLMNDTLAAFYGTPLQPSAYGGYINLSFMATPLGAGNSFSSTSVLSGDVVAATPEPVSIVLLGTTLVLFGTIWRRRLTRS
jgi:hypothetical protein